MTTTEDGVNALELATELTIAWLSNPNTRATVDDVPTFLQSVHAAVAGLSAPSSEVPAYSETRRSMAKKIGLGRKPGEKRGRTARSKTE